MSHDRGWLETVRGLHFVRADLPTEERRQRRYLGGALIMIMLVLSGFAWLDAAAGRSDDLLRMIVLEASLGLAVLGVARWNRWLDIVRFAIGIGFVYITYETIIGTNDGVSFVWFYISPLAAFFLLGRREALVWVGVAGTLIAILLFAVDRQITPDGDLAWLALATYCLLVVLSFGLETARNSLSTALEEETRRLERALADVEALRDLVPICASCKSIRDDRGYWRRIEAYLEDHTDVELRSAVCPSCVALEDETADRIELAQAMPAAFADLESASESEHDRRRRTYFRVGLAALAPTTLFFASIDWRAGRFLEAGLVFALVTWLTVAAMRLRARPQDRRYFLISLIVAVTVLAFQLGIGSYGGYVFLWCYSLPAFSIFLLGHRLGAVGAAATGVMAAVILITPIGFDYPPERAARFLATYALAALLAYGLEASRRKYHDQLVAEQAALQEALDQVSTLRGLLPLCPECKNVRDDHGFWDQLESHLGRVAGTRFSHGLCPECSAELLREIDQMEPPGMALPPGIGAGASGTP